APVLVIEWLTLSDVWVMSGSAAAVTLTVSAIAPGWRLALTSATAEVRTMTFEYTAAENPGASKRTSYGPGSKLIRPYVPSSRVVVSRLRLSTSAVALTVAPATAAPMGSVTIPKMAPVFSVNATLEVDACGSDLPRIFSESTLMNTAMEKSSYVCGLPSGPMLRSVMNLTVCVTGMIVV